MRIAQLITRSDAVGGATVHVRDLSVGLQRAGHEVVVFLGEGEGPVPSLLDEAGVPWHSVPSLRREFHLYHDAAALIKLVKSVGRWKPHLLACHTSKAGALGRAAGRLLKIPTVYTPHCWSFVDGFPGAKKYLALEKCLRLITDHVIAVSEWEHELALAKGVCSAKQMTTIYNGLPDLPRDRDAQGSEIPKLICVARFEVQKDHQTLLRALTLLPERAWQIDFVGSGPLEAQIKAEANALGIAERVRFLGGVSDADRMLPQYDVFVLSSKWESFPISILEAMRCGLPVVATDVGGIGEAVVNEQTGYLVPARDPHALAAALSKLVSSSPQRTSMGAAGREKFIESFHFDTMFRATEHLYRTLFEAHTTRNS